MRTVAIKDPDVSSLDLSRRSHGHAARLAERLNAAAKPEGFPHTDVSKSNSTPAPLTISKGAAVGLAVAAVLDMLDDGRLERVELLRMLKRLREIDPLEADRRLWEKIERRNDSDS